MKPLMAWGMVLLLQVSLLSTLGEQPDLRYTPSRPLAVLSPEPVYCSGTLWSFVHGCIEELAAYHPGFEQALDLTFTSSNGAFDALLKGQTRIALVSYRLPVAEHEAFAWKHDRALHHAPVIKDAVCVGVHPDNPLTEISLPELDAVFGVDLLAGFPRRITTWGELGVEDPGLRDKAIVPYGGAEGWGTVEFFRERVLQGGAFTPAMVAADVVFGSRHTRSVEHAILHHPDRAAIGFMSYRPRDVRLLQIGETTRSQSYAPEAGNIYAETYPYLVRKMYVYLDYPGFVGAPPQVRELVSFMLSVEGQAVAAKRGHLPMTTPELIRARRILTYEDPAAFGF